MTELFTNGRIVDLILIGVVLELAVIVMYRRRTGRGITLADLLPNLLAGGFLLIAVRFAMLGSNWTAIAACFACAGVAHIIDVGRRWGGERRP